MNWNNSWHDDYIEKQQAPYSLIDDEEEDDEEADYDFDEEIESNFEILETERAK